MFQPLGDRILVKPGPDTRYTPGGLTIPESVLGRTRHGEVLAVGDGRLPTGGIDVILEPRVAPGDTVLFMRDDGIEYEEGKEKYLILKEDQILGIIK